MHSEKRASQSQLLNLDKLAMETALELAHRSVDKKKLENLSTKALGVLQEQGIFAMMLFLLSRSSTEEKIIAFLIAESLLQRVLILLRYENDTSRTATVNTNDLLFQNLKEKRETAIQKLKELKNGNKATFNISQEVIHEIMDFASTTLTQELHLLLLIRNFYQLTLTYLRYIAKGMDD